MNTTSVVTLLSRVSQVKPSNKEGAIALYFHYLLQQIEELECTKVHDTDVSSPTAPIPDSWNSSSSCYSFQYTKDSKHYYVRVSRTRIIAVNWLTGADSSYG